MVDIAKLSKESKAAISKCKSLKQLEYLRIRYLGRKGMLTKVLRSLGNLPLEQRKELGREANLLKRELETMLDEYKQKILKATYIKKISTKTVDITLPPRPVAYFHPHPLLQVLYNIVDIFTLLGFAVSLGPEIETDWYNFEALNIPKEHPARDMQDTFYISTQNLAEQKLLLRTHTSPVQIRVMEKTSPPIRIIVPGKVYRHEATDATHSAVFYQVEGLCVDKNITFADLQATLAIFVCRFFGKGTEIRFRPSYFPFTEPSAELDIKCMICSGKGCSVCKNSGWVEVLGCGMVHPKLFERVGYEKDKYTGFAFGLGVERVAMLKYEIMDMRLFYQNDIRFLRQW